MIEDSGQSNKLKVLYQQTRHLLEEEIPTQLQRRIKFAPYQTNFVDEHLKEARKCKASLDYHWLAYISKGTKQAMNAVLSNANQAVNNNESNSKYPKFNNPVAQTVQNGATASRQETDYVSEKSLSKQRREERMKKKFDTKFETKMRSEQAPFEGTMLEQEMQLKELETKHQLLEEERELMLKVKRTTLENDDVRSQSTSARGKSPFNWISKKRDFSTGPVGSTTV